MIVAAIQPGYMPWVGFFDLMKRCDLFVVADNLQYTKQDWRSRNRIRSPEGFAYISVPVKRAHRGTPINKIEINNNHPWQTQHMNVLKYNYRNAPFWPKYEPVLQEMFDRDWIRLLDLDLWCMEFFANEFKINTPTMLLSDLPVTFGRDKTDSLIALTRAVGADTFLEGASGKQFVDISKFDEAGLSIEFQEYVCRPYRQQFEPFMSHLSALDLLLNEGPAGTTLI